MALPRKRIHPGSDSPHPHEREAIAFALEQLPDRDPLEAWTLQELLDPSTGELLEIDLIVLGPHALYLIEIKGWPDGKLGGDSLDWSWQPKGAPEARYFPNPYRGANHKAKVLKGRLGRELRKIRVEALVFISSRELDTNRLATEARSHVVFRKDFAGAVVEAAYPGVHPKARDHHIDRATAKRIVQQLASIGLRARRGGQRFGSWDLQGLIASGPGYQEYFARHTLLDQKQDSGQARVRVYRNPPHEDSSEGRARLRQLAQREFARLFQLAECDQVLKAREFCENETTHDPALVFEPFQGADPFSSFLRLNPELSFDDRLAVIQQVGWALHACHRKEVLHRGLTPEVVLVRRAGSNAPLEVRLAGFQHARTFTSTTLQTLHSTSVSSPEHLAYRAPEILGGQDVGSPESDVFSLAAFAYFALTGKPPANSPEDLIQQVQEHGGLLPGLVQDDLTLLDPEFRRATASSPTERPTVEEFLDALEERLTSPDSERTTVGPLEARPGDTLEGGFVVHAILGKGSFARVLEVETPDEERLALKVPLHDAAEQALLAEAEVLGRLRHPGIVRLVDTVRPGGRTCLLLGLADPETLGDRISKRGPLSLDLARRYGQNLLEALLYLEREGLTHRDIKPHNLALTHESEKRASQLLLIDFSLAAASLDRIQLSTLAYRDPWLNARGHWDAAADRYSATVTLHEMLTGVRPDYGERVNPAAVTNPSPRIDATRFESSVREGLVHFFRRALAPQAEDRFASSDDMLHEWNRVFREPESFEPPLRHEKLTTPPRPFELRADITAETPLAAFVSDPVLLDALTRSGAETALDVARLPRNRLSAAPGIGSDTQNLVLELVTGLRRRFATELQKDEAVLSGYRLASEPLLELRRDLLPPDQLQRLHNAGIRTTVELARAGQQWVERILAPDKVRASTVRRRLEAYQEGADAEEVVPATLEGWLDLWLTAGKLDAQKTKAGALRLTKTKRAGWAYLGLPIDDDDAAARLRVGLDDPLAYPRTSDIAKAIDASQPTVSNAIGFARDAWRAHPSKPAFARLASDTLLALGGAASVHDASERLRFMLGAASGNDPSGNAQTERRQAAALLRIATLLTDTEDEPVLTLTRRRPRDGSPAEIWFGLTPDHVRAADALGEAADDLVRPEGPDAPPAVPAFPSVRRTLIEAAATFFPDPPSPELLLPLAARASRYAACSRKLELYVKGLPAADAVNLARAAIQGAIPPGDPDAALSPEQLRSLVRERYPEAEPLPEHPDLDALLEPLALTWNDQSEGYTRRPDDEGSAQPTIQRTTRRQTASRDQRIAHSDAAIVARRFDDALRLAVERRLFRVVQCLDIYYQRAIDAISEFLDASPISFDQLLIDRLDELTKQYSIPPQKLIEADRTGPTSVATSTAAATCEGDWRNLCRLAAEAADGLLDRVGASEDGPRLVVHPGLIARYRLERFLRRWIERSEEDSGAAVVLLVPSEQGDDPTIDGKVPIPITSQAQRLWLSTEWLRNEHKAAEEGE